MPSKGDWIPVEVKQIPGIDFIEAGILSKAASYEAEGLEFYATNEALAEDFLCSSRTMKRKIKHLEDIGIVKIVSITKRKRLIKLRDKMAYSDMPRGTKWPTQRDKMAHSEGQNGPPLIKVLKKDYITWPDFDEKFEKIWKEYPRKDKKAYAKDIFKKKLKTYPTFEEMLIAVKAYSASVRLKNIEARYIPHFSTWLNEKVWADLLETAKQDPLCDVCKSSIVNGTCINCGKEF